MLFGGDIGKLLIIIGGILIIVGLFFVLGGKFPFWGKLPGDLFVQKGNFKFYFLLGSSILISFGLTVLLNLIFWIFRK